MLTHYGLCEVFMYACKLLHPIIMAPIPLYLRASRWLAGSSAFAGIRVSLDEPFWANSCGHRHYSAHGGHAIKYCKRMD